MANRKQSVLDSDQFGTFVLGTDRPASMQVFDHLRIEIITGRIAPGTQLSEANLCNHFAVSRQPVREALLRLSTEHLVRIYPQRGSIVTPISVPMVRRAQVIREAVEIEMVGRAIELRTDAFLNDLKTEIQIQETFVAAGDIQRFFESDQSFHRRICEQSGVSGIWEALAASRSQLDRARHAELQMADNLGKLIAQHKEIRTAIAEGDRDTAVETMRLHLRRVLTSLADSIERAPELFEDAGDAEG